MKKANKILAVILTLAVEAFLIAMLVFSVSNILPKKWDIRENSAISQINSDGTMSMAPVRYFARTKQDSVERKANGSKAINDLYITMMNENISADYIRENGFTKNIELKKLSSSANDLCYEISGAENGAVWEVWITFENTGSPYMTIVKTGGTK
ncbi:MAG: hypothetical protein K2G60_01490 [Oscillospiraceae bacterium]|nr:hypothetical protein [Oscillospiraceae bacterium]